MTARGIAVNMSYIRSGLWNCSSTVCSVTWSNDTRLRCCLVGSCSRDTYSLHIGVEKLRDMPEDLAPGHVQLPSN